MVWLAIRMLVGDRAKYLGIVSGVAFASLLMAHQVSIFVGLMRRTASQVYDVTGADLWVMRPEARHVDETPALADTDLYRVRGVDGVAWAVRLYKGNVAARLPEGRFRNLILMGLDDTTLIGGPSRMVMGRVADLRRPDSIVIDEAGYKYLWPGEPLKLGRAIEINDRRAVIVGICKASAPFQTLPVVFARYGDAMRYAPPQRRRLTFVLAGCEPGADPAVVSRAVGRRTGLRAVPHGDFVRMTIGYFLGSTGIPVNFGITVALGFVVGVAVAGQTFYLFTIENLKQYGALKAMGLDNRRLTIVVLVQAVVVGVQGYAIGMGGAAAFFEATKNITHLAGFYLPWQVMALTAVAVVVIVALASAASLRTVLTVEPAIVFRGP